MAYEFATITRGTLEKTVSASGSLKPVATVDVLPRMSGKVEKVYVDYNDRIKRGDILVELNTDMLRLQREQQNAAVLKARANYELQLVNYRNQEKLAEKDLISEYELKTGKTTLDIQQAELSAAEASLRVIETEINQYAFITSPIDGIVLARNVNEGETVVDSSSSNSASIFTLAENLEEMQIEAGVGELDIASIWKGQIVRFTLEALPGRTYSGVVETRRLMPTVQDNVVSYTVIINVDNQDGSLLPGMTCMVEFIEERNENILLVPNAALRYQPSGMSADEIAERLFKARPQGMDAGEREAVSEARDSGNARTGSGGLTGLVMGGSQGNPMGGGRGGAGFSGGPGGPGRPGGSAGAAGNAGNRQRGAENPPKALWYINDEGRPDCILVRTGISDGSYTEIRPLGPPGGDMGASEGIGTEGFEVILREKV
jgi:HlyD family secretion protein